MLVDTDKMRFRLTTVCFILTCFHAGYRSAASSPAVMQSFSGKHLTLGSEDPPVQPDKVRLYSMRYCPFSQRATLVALAKHVPFEVVFINLKAKPEWYTNRVPTGKVPALLVDGHNNVYESLILADYLDEKYSERPLHSKDPLRKAKDRILIENFGSKVIGTFYKVMTGANPSEENFALVVNELKPFDKELGSRNTPFFGGDKAGMLDYMIWPWFERIEMFKVLYGEKFAFPAQTLPTLATWMTSMKADDAVKQYYLSPEDHAKFIRTNQAGSPDYDILTH